MAVTSVDLPLVPERLRERFLGREAYRRTRYIVVRGRDGVALLKVAKASEEPLFSPITDVEVLAGPDEIRLAHAARRWTSACPRRSAGRPSRRPGRALRRRPGPVRARELHPRPGRRCGCGSWRSRRRSRPSCSTRLRRVLEVAEDLPPVQLVPEVVDIVELARQHPPAPVPLPCRGSGAAPEGADGLLPRRAAAAAGLDAARLRALAGDPPLVLRRRPAVPSTCARDTSCVDRPAAVPC